MSTISLDELAIKHKADKSSLYHNFAVKYDRLLSPFRDTFINVLEIGIGGGHSIKMWADYFPNATIHGADISLAYRACELYSNRIQLHMLDQGKVEQLGTLKPFAPFDFIIDDGNHFWWEQIVSFRVLFPFVRQGGLYIIEDTCTSYWKEYANHAVSCVEYFKVMVDDLNLHGARGRVPSNPPPDFGNWEKGWHRREDCHGPLPDFDSIQFLNSIIVIHKR